MQMSGGPGAEIVGHALDSFGQIEMPAVKQAEEQKDDESKNCRGAVGRIQLHAGLIKYKNQRNSRLRWFLKKEERSYGVVLCPARSCEINVLL